ncbi:hypothetical protein [Allohahella sp. A8]|uniref:hypothetical protein n=1 Tax=Allohahella sp. A8 TaxID=3141461 RepID=UPI003A7F7DAA
MMSILSILLALTIFFLGILKPTRSSWKYASILAVLLCGVNIYNYYEQENLKTFFLNGLADIATRIHWDESSLTLKVFNSIDRIEASDVQVQFKIFPKNSIILTELDIEKTECKLDNKFGYGYLSERKAVEIYKKYAETDGSIYLDNERKEGVDHLFFNGIEKTEFEFGEGEVSFQLELGPNTNSNFSSLAKLNGAYIIAYIKTNYSEGAMAPWAQFNLKTNAGTHAIHFTTSIFRFLEDGTKQLETSNVRLAGVCIPDDFFFSPSEVT